MNKILVTVGKKQFSKRQIRSLEQIIRQNYRQYVHPTKLLVLWNMVPQGNMYNDFKEQQPSILVIECEKGFAQNKREQMFQSCMHDWVAITGQDINDVVISVLENPTFNTLLRRNSAQLTSLGKLRFYTHVLGGLVASKLINKYYSFNSSF